MLLDLESVLCCLLFVTYYELFFLSILILIHLKVYKYSFSYTITLTSQVTLLGLEFFNPIPILKFNNIDSNCYSFQLLLTNKSLTQHAC